MVGEIVYKPYTALENEGGDAWPAIYPTKCNKSVIVSFKRTIPVLPAHTFKCMVVTVLNGRWVDNSYVGALINSRAAHAKKEKT